MSLTLVVGVGVIAALFLVIAFKLDEEHGILRLAFIMFAMGLLFLIPSSVVQEGNVCEQLVSSSTVTGDTTTYNYTTSCYLKANGSVAFVKAVKYPYWLFIAYLVVYLFYRSALALGMASRNGRLTRFFRGFKR
jgi:ABC-type uncharacterized transport system permease subunit